MIKYTEECYAILIKPTQVNAKIGSQHLPMSITIMEKGPDFLFGLDMLRRYQCNIDLKANLLRFSVQPEARRSRSCLVDADPKRACRPNICTRR